MSFGSILKVILLKTVIFALATTNQIFIVFLFAIGLKKIRAFTRPNFFVDD